jgi:hypothetical protein
LWQSILSNGVLIDESFEDGGELLLLNAWDPKIASLTPQH